MLHRVIATPKRELISFGARRVPVVITADRSVEGFSRHPPLPEMGARLMRVVGQIRLHWSSSDVEIHRLVVGPLDNNVFVVRCRHTGEAVLIDAADEHAMLLDICKHLGVRTVLETHGHWDHIGAVPAIRDAGFKVGVAQADAYRLPSYDYFLEDTSIIEVGKARLEVLATPGHTEGSLSFKLIHHPIVFLGDSLFPGGVGKTTSPAAFATAIESADQRLFRLPGNTIVMPGHGRDTTIGTERPQLDAWIERGY